MELQKAIESRRSIRKYKSDDIDDKTIIKLIDNARIAPSAKNTQPWRFYIARGEEKNNIATIMKDYHNKFPEGTIGMKTTADVIEEAPVLILVFRTSDSTTTERQDALSIGAAIEHILLSAQDMGLGSLWIAATYRVRDEIAKSVNIDMDLYSAVAIGIANENPDMRPRKTLNEIIINK